MFMFIFHLPNFILLFRKCLYLSSEFIFFVYSKRVNYSNIAYHLVVVLKQVVFRGPNIRFNCQSTTLMSHQDFCIKWGHSIAYRSCLEKFAKTMSHLDRPIRTSMILN